MFFFSNSLDHNLVYVGGWIGYRNHFSTIEFKNINNNKTCHIKSLNNEIAYHASVVTPIGVVTCGGETANGNRTKDCFRLTNQNNWEMFPSMNIARDQFDVVVVGSILVAFGGYLNENTYEKINWRNGEKWDVTNTNQSFYRPCVTKWNEESIFITGGTNKRWNVSNSNFVFIVFKLINHLNSKLEVKVAIKYHIAEG